MNAQARPTVALLVPAVDEEAGIVATARVMRDALDASLVQTAVVLDGGSTDATADVARREGVTVVTVSSLMPELGEVLGKGDSLFRGVHTVEADWYVFLDADLGNISLDHVRALVEPISREGVVFVKGGFVRVDEHGTPRPVPGGRVTEDVVRPALATEAPELARLSQPLSGQVVVRADVARSLRFVTGYGVEIAMLVDIWREFGASAIVEADMGEVHNRFKPDDALMPVERDVRWAMWWSGIGTIPETDPVRLTERRLS